MRASFIIKWHTRRIDNLMQMLRLLELWHLSTIQDCELILLCHDSCSDIDTKFAVTRCFNLNLPEMMAAKQTNFGVTQAQCERIILLDSDRILPSGYFDKVIDQMCDNIMISTSNMVKLLDYRIDQEIINGTYFSSEERRTTNEIGTRCIWSGNVIFNKSDYQRAGSMDEKYIGYGWEDNDMGLTMEKAGVVPILRNELEIHLYHEPFTYGSKDQKKLFVQNGLYFCRKWGIKPYPEILTKEMKQYAKII